MVPQALSPQGREPTYKIELLTQSIMATSQLPSAVDPAVRMALTQTGWSEEIFAWILCTKLISHVMAQYIGWGGICQCFSPCSLFPPLSPLHGSYPIPPQLEASACFPASPPHFSPGPPPESVPLFQAFSANAAGPLSRSFRPEQNTLYSEPVLCPCPFRSPAMSRFSASTPT